MRHTDYALDNTPPSTAANPTRNVPVASVDAGLFFERDLASGWIQTLEPRLYYLYQAYEYQGDLPRFDAAMLTFSYRQLFRDNRFAGLDRIGDANRVAIGVTSRLLNAATGAERLTARLGTTGYLRDRRVTLTGPPGADERQSTSALAGEVQARVGPLALTSTFAWDHHDGELDETGFGVDVQARQPADRQHRLPAQNALRRGPNGRILLLAAGAALVCVRAMEPRLAFWSKHRALRRDRIRQLLSGRQTGLA